MAHIKDWDTLKKLAAKVLVAKKLEQVYIDRLKFEIKEIDKQGANRYWLDLFNHKARFEHNKNGLVLPFLLGITKIDPILEGIEHKVEYHPDFPDIDIDFLPEAREHVKHYAKQQYGDDYVCTVGMWIRYKAKLALQDAATALGVPRGEVIAVCKHLPEEFDTMPFDQAYNEFENFKIFADENPELVRLAYGMAGKIKAQSKHAGGLIISSVPIRDHVPLTYSGSKGNKQWTSAWTEGMADTQLSKFGLIKFDILGLINIAYIWDCKNKVLKNHRIKIDFEDIDPEDNRAGWLEYPDGKREKVLLNDPDTLKAADELKLSSIFQFDTDFQQSVVEKGGVRSFMDLVIYTSLGRPGPLPMIDVYIGNRDDQHEQWNDVLHPVMQDILQETKGVLTFQEQLLRTWTELCGFTMPEAEKLQKAVKKKRGEFLEKMSPKVIEGASELIGQDEAEALWDKMVSFGRYCFNKSHAVAYIMIAYRCLWLKTKFPAEWWASVLSHCPDHKFVRYMGSARTEGIKFGTLDVNNLTDNFTVQGSSIIPGLASIKGIGDEKAHALAEESAKESFTGVDNFVERCGSSKLILERLIKLGAFDNINPNRKALWMWYLYKYATGKEITLLRRQINYCYTWPQDNIRMERKRQEIEYRRQYPNRKVPKRITEWVPSSPVHNPREFDPDVELTKLDVRLGKKFKLDCAQVIALFPADFKLAKRLEAERDYLGFYWSSPLDVFQHQKNTTIEFAKTCGVLECVIEEKHSREGANGEYYILNVNDGMATARVNVWGNEVHLNDPEVFQPGTGVQMEVIWKDQYRSFSVKSRSLIIPLPYKEEEDESFEELSQAEPEASTQDELAELKDMLENIDDLERDFYEAE